MPLSSTVASIVGTLQGIARRIAPTRSSIVRYLKIRPIVTFGQYRTVEAARQLETRLAPRSGQIRVLANVGEIALTPWCGSSLQS